MNAVRFGIIGIGNMGSVHAKSLMEGKIDGAVLSAVCDIREERRRWAKEELHVSADAVFADADAFFENAAIDAVLIATPHYFHTAVRGARLR